MEETLTNRQKLRSAFLTYQAEEKDQYISDLESALKINKEIIYELCQPLPEKEARTITILNEENSKLHEQSKMYREKKLKAEAEVLIMQQTIQSYKLKELEHEKELLENASDLKGQMDMKELMLQIAEKRCIDAGYIILKYLHYVPEAISLVDGLRIRLQEGRGLKISNVVEQNESLKSAKTKLEKAIVELKQEVFDLKEKVVCLEQNNSEMKLMIEALGKQCEELRQQSPGISMFTKGEIVNNRDFSFEAVSNLSAIMMQRKLSMQVPSPVEEPKQLNEHSFR